MGLRVLVGGNDGEFDAVTGGRWWRGRPWCRTGGLWRGFEFFDFGNGGYEAIDGGDVIAILGAVDRAGIEDGGKSLAERGHVGGLVGNQDFGSSVESIREPLRSFAFERAFQTIKRRKVDVQAKTFGRRGNNLFANLWRGLKSRCRLRIRDRVYAMPSIRKDAIV